MTNTAPPAAPTFRNSRRFTTGAVVMTHLDFIQRDRMGSGGFGFAGWRAGCAMDRFADALVSSAAADIAAHEVVDVGVAGVGLLGKQGHRGHDLPGLAIAALRNILFDPGLLHRMAAVGGKPFDGGDLLTGNRGNGRLAGARGLSVDVHGTRAAESRSTAEFCAGFVERVAQHPEQRHLRADVHGFGLSVENKSDGHRRPPGVVRYRTTTPDWGKPTTQLRG